FGQDLDLLYERGRLLQEEIASRLGEQTNRNLYVLSIVTTIFLPMTLIVGLFGINVGGMPWLQDYLGFWWVVLGMFAAALVTFLFRLWSRVFGGCLPPPPALEGGGGGPGRVAWGGWGSPPADACKPSPGALRFRFGRRPLPPQPP